MPKKKAKDEIFFVGLKDRIEIRRSLLESAKEAIQYMQRFERFKKVRDEKEDEVKKLKEIVHEIHSLVRKVKARLPKTKLRAKLHKHEEEINKIDIINIEQSSKKGKEATKQEPNIEEPVKKTKAKSEIEKLESELSEIEGRLTNLV